MIPEIKAPGDVKTKPSMIGDWVIMFRRGRKEGRSDGRGKGRGEGKETYREEAKEGEEAEEREEGEEGVNSSSIILLFYHLSSLDCCFVIFSVC